MTDEGVGRRIRELRQEQGLLQAALVKPGLLSAGYLSLIESGRRRPSPEVLRYLAEQLGTTPDHLATGRQPDLWQETERRLAFAELALQHATAEDALREFEAVTRSGPPPFHARAELGRARALELLGRTEQAITAYEALWKAAEPGTALWAERATDVLRCSRDLGDYGYAADLGERAMATFEDLGVEWSDSAVRLGVTLAGVYIHRSDLVRAAHLLRRLIEISDGTGSPLARGSAYWNAAVTAHYQGRGADAKAFADRALALFGETDHQRNLAVLRTFYGELLLDGEPADPGQAREFLLDAHDRLTQLGSPAEISECETYLARAAVQLGDLDEALRWAQAARSRLTADAAPVAEAEALIALGMVHLAANDPAQAFAALDEGERALAHAAPGRSVVNLWNRMGSLHEERGDTTAALRSYRQGLTAAGYRQPSRPLTRSDVTASAG
ncbi:helix-turn-helix domain-containing protein [Nonomuraea sp. K274]|uniref:Helix-turn-helix domain-containing protein n=1 Tax=Nonomuraea cypriaca TaxID=1187855 RepID=A0A931EZY1_9ACTN|nr:helix-turn-helix domain-containing protein [Nonomuraea cypriaca]MBF8186621.1 helix-turn-helix domain-containing protein [Nonomuraea cypriaca]